jgi:uncharacterized domain 1
MDDSYFLDRMDKDVHGQLDSVRGIYLAPMSRENDIEIISVSKDSVRTSMELKEKHMNGNRVAHGAATFILIDDTFAFASNLFEPAVGVNVSVSYHRPAVGGTLEAVSQLISETRSLSVFDIKVYCSGKHIATAVCTAFKTGKK